MKRIFIGGSNKVNSLEKMSVDIFSEEEAGADKFGPLLVFLLLLET